MDFRLPMVDAEPLQLTHSCSAGPLMTFPFCSGTHAATDSSQIYGIHIRQVNHKETAAMARSPLPQLTPEQRLKQVAAIFARGLLRLQRANRSDAQAPEKKVLEILPKRP